MVEETAIGGPAREFPRTRWTLIASSRESAEGRRVAMEELLRAYWKPLYTYARRKGLNIEAAKDAIQEFFARLLERDFLAALDPGKGPLRAYLKASLSNFLVNQHESAVAEKRGGGRVAVALDFDVAERDLERVPDGPDAAFDREWAVGIMERSTERLRREFEGGDRKGPFELVLRFLGFGEAPSYADAAEGTGMSVVQLKAFLHRARTRFRELVREEVAETAGDPDEELGELLRALRS
ncbi:MAG TPA: sigma-70 family RNA polymerase sigma factor [Planctomycetota bacterium]|nr:sigma-70 family RNA polymerase sigma factor [Planctomycetota bacterium]